MIPAFFTILDKNGSVDPYRIAVQGETLKQIMAENEKNFLLAGFIKGFTTDKVLLRLTIK